MLNCRPSRLKAGGLPSHRIEQRDGLRSNALFPSQIAKLFIGLGFDVDLIHCDTAIGSNMLHH